jgi:SNF2 family DNA or RNA helicase
VRLGITQACAGFLLRPGMGKTTIAYAIHQILKSKELIKRTLVISPIRPMYNVWPRQKDSWAQFTDIDVVVCHGKDRLKNFRDLSHEMYIINPDGLEWLTADPENLAHLRQHFDVLVVDESTKFKSTGTLRFKRMRKFIKHFKRRYILTGSFTPKGLMDLFGQIYLLDEGGSLGAFITQYKSKYFYATDHMGYNLVPHDWAAPAIANKIAPLVLVLEREGNIDLPELLPPNDIYVDLPPAARKQYDAMESHMLAALSTQELVVAANAAVASSKCRQIANGGLYTNAGDGEWEDMHDAKIEALKDLVDELSGEVLLIAYEFKFDLEKLQKAFPTAALLTTGNPKKDDMQIAAFAGGLYTVGLGQFSSISLGIDGLQNSCSNVAMYGLTWNLQDYSQTIDRVWRTGSKSPVVSVHRIIARNTVDEKVLSVLNNREATQTSFLTLLRELRN